MSDFERFKYVDSLSWKNKAMRLVWGGVWLFLFRPTPRIGFNKWRVFLLSSFGAKIGSGCRIASSCKVWAPWNLEMGSFSVLGDDVDCYSMGKITIGSKVAVSQRAFLCTGSHDISNLQRPLVIKPILIQDHAWICAQATVFPGVVIGEGGVVSACSVARESTKAWSIYAGNPAVEIKPRILAKDVK